MNNTTTTILRITTSVLLPTSTTRTPKPEPTTPSTNFDEPSYKFPFVFIFIITIWLILGCAYLLSRYRQRPRIPYIIPRVFVLCSPRTVQFHYELILRIGLPSHDFNPDKHDIDVTVFGKQRNEVVPMTRLNTKTLLDEPLITSLSIIVYRLVEMPPLGGLLLKQSGPYKSGLYIYDLTVIDLATNKEQYYTLNHYIGSLNRELLLDEPNVNSDVYYPIDDVPMPKWTIGDAFLFLYSVMNYMMLSALLMPLNCSYKQDMLAIMFIAFGGGTLVFFLEWLLYYHLRWNQDRREYFSDYQHSLMAWFPRESWIRIAIGSIFTLVGGYSIYRSINISDLKESLVWLLAVVDSASLVIGLWNVARQVEMGESIVNLGLKLRGIESVPTGMRYSEIVSDTCTKSGSTSEDGSSNTSLASRMASRAVRPRSSVKSFGFDTSVGNPGLKLMSSYRQPGSRMSATGATPNNLTTSSIALRSAPTLVNRSSRSNFGPVK